MKLAIIIPAYNEVSVIGSVIAHIPEKIDGIKEYEVIVVDDCSADRTKEAAEWMGATVLRHRLNLGAGGATMTGLEYASRNGFDIAVTMDADGQHDPEDISTLTQSVLRGNDLVIGSRLINLRKEDMPAIKRFGNRAFSLVTFLFYRIWVTDSQSGFRALSKRAIEKCRITNAGYELCSEMIGKAKEAKLKIYEVPIKTIYTEYSKIKGQHYLNGFNIVIRLTLSKLKGNS